MPPPLTKYPLHWTMSLLITQYSKKTQPLQKMAIAGDRKKVIGEFSAKRRFPPEKMKISCKLLLPLKNLWVLVLLLLNPPKIWKKIKFRRTPKKKRKFNLEEIQTLLKKEGIKKNKNVFCSAFWDWKSVASPPPHLKTRNKKALEKEKKKNLKRANAGKKAKAKKKKNRWFWGPWKRRKSLLFKGEEKTNLIKKLFWKKKKPP